MSLINLSSETRNSVLQQKAFNFRNFFPQPLIIKPNSQVCLSSFYHFRSEYYYRVSTLNNIIAFGFGDRNTNSMMYAAMDPGRYTGEELAVEIPKAMNAVNLQQNYTWSCTFTIGNRNANPPTEDVFVISYENVPTPTTKGGVWSFLNSRSSEGTLTNNNGDDESSTLVSLTEDELPCVVDNGLLLHEGSVTIANLGLTQAKDLEEYESHETSFGIIRQSMAVDSANMADATSFNSDYGDILFNLQQDDNAGVTMQISTLTQRQGTTNIFLPDNRGKRQVMRRVAIQTEIEKIFTSSLDRFQIIITRVASQRAFAMQIQKSTDGGVTYTDIADGAAGAVATDGRPLIYSQTIGGVAFTSLIYSTLGVSNGAGGIVINPESGKTSAAINAANGIKAPLIPFISLFGENTHVTGLSLDQQTFQVNTGQGSPVLDADNQFTLQFDEDTTNGYEYIISINTGAVTPVAQCNENDWADLAIGNPYITGGLVTYNVFSNNLTPIGTAVEIGIMSYDPEFGNFGEFTFTGLSSGTAITIDPVELNATISAPDPTSIAARYDMNGIFNPSNNPITLRDGTKVLKSDKYKQTHVEPANELETENPLDDVTLGADLAQASYLVLTRANQQDVGDNAGAPVRATNDMRCGNSGQLLGFGAAINVNDNATFEFTSNTEPLNQIDDTSIHIEIPEFTNIKSYEGEAENISKTIKVIPKNEFTKDDNAGSMTYTAPYEDWVDINNAETIVLNELNLQVKKPNGQLADTLEPITRATIKIRQDPEVKRSQDQREMMQMMSRMGQPQNPTPALDVNIGSFVGS